MSEASDMLPELPWPTAPLSRLGVGSGLPVSYYAAVHTKAVRHSERDEKEVATGILLGNSEGLLHHAKALEAELLELRQSLIEAAS